MPKGGARVGAGRKAGLNELEVRLLCDLYRELSQAAALAEADRRLEDRVAPETREIWARMAAVPVPDRAAWLRSEEAEMLREDLYFIRRERDRVPDTEDRDGARLHEQLVKRVYGARDGIIDTTAARMSELLGRPISTSQVRKAIKGSLNSDHI